MADVIAGEWRFKATSVETVTVFPDGCRDVIWCAAPGAAAGWRLSALDATARRVAGLTRQQMHGFRLRAGASVSPELFAGALPADPEAGAEAISALCQVEPAVQEVLAGCWVGPCSVAGLAAALRVTPRSIERLLAEKTGRGPLSSTPSNASTT